MKSLLALLLLLSLPSLCAAADPPDCTGENSWPAAMAGVELKNAGMVKDLRFKHIAVKRIASERIGKDLYRQVHGIRFTTENDVTIEVITVNDASHEECSMSDVAVYRASPVSRERY